jgi:predicted metal-dependent phosphoesterase TrpH
MPEGEGAQPGVVGVAIDLHVHTSRYSGCAEFLAPREIAKRAREVGLDAVVLTDHDVLWENEERDTLQAENPEIRFFRGLECTTDGGHLVLVGLEDAGALTRGIAFAEAIRLAHLQDAAVILAHPFRDSDPDKLPLGLVDAIEVASTSFHDGDTEASCALASRWGKPTVASSDAHALSRLGWAWTSFPRMPSDEHALAGMIRAGEGRVVLPPHAPVRG